MRRPVLVLALALVVVLMAGPGAAAHVEVRESDPGAGESVGSGIDEITLTLIALDPSGPISVSVRDADGAEVTTGDPELSERTSVVTVPVDSLEPGDYTVEWSALADDGDGQTSGTYEFSVTDSQLGAGIWLLWAAVILVPAFIFLRPKGRRRRRNDDDNVV